MAGTEHREVVWVDLEVIVALGISHQLGIDLGICFDHLAATMADEMAMSCCSEVKGGRSLAGMGMLDDPDALELLNDAIDRRTRHFGTRLLDERCERIDAEMSRVARQDLEGHPLRRRDPSAGRSNSLDSLVDPFSPHGARLGA